ncbi:gamma-glutamyl-gamma-aminobutyrate hydrolase family protein [Alpinimonas psychrophila]|uniref:Putative glutamine amidotransferase n=1 Tax=Alpinimonas psychrophila TaxID=748908 RepID=A0A7W3JVG2_9MICO|nr:gamma-glutamyl-gamma-aminobutyrate hydrolase family protein [Alpinimonas psychrophila]MBA8829887.1 putative glutamine amidotransferase [Alpinimonas psychrophila]
MTASPRPRIAILGRFASSTSATRFEALVGARKLVQGVWNAGGEPLTMLPVSGSDWAERLRGIDGVLMPGGADMNPARYGQVIESHEIYDVDDLADENDLGMVTFALEAGIPVLAICRGLQVVNVARGGTLVQDMAAPHRHHVAPVTIDAYVAELGLSTNVVQASCYHHQMIDTLGKGLEVIARSAEGYIEAVKIDSPAWAFGVQWHPEDNFETNLAQAELFEGFIQACSV